MTKNEAYDVCRNIENVDLTQTYKAMALYTIMDPKDMKNLTKDELCLVISWLWDQVFEYSEA